MYASCVSEPCSLNSAKYLLQQEDLLHQHYQHARLARASVDAMLTGRKQLYMHQLTAELHSITRAPKMCFVLLLPTFAPGVVQGLSVCRDAIGSVQVSQLGGFEARLGII